MNLAKIFFKKYLYSDAIEIFRKCLLNWDKNDKIGLHHLYTLISFAYLQLTFFDFAQLYLEQAIFTSPNSITAVNNLLYSYKQRYLPKKYFELISYFQKKIKSKYNVIGKPLWNLVFRNLVVSNFFLSV